MANFDAAVNDMAPGPVGLGQDNTEERDRMRAAGLPRNYRDPILLTLDRADFTRILQFIEERAVKAENYIEIRQAVLFSELLRSQARKQGY